MRLPFDEKVEHLNEALLAAAERDPLLLEEPSPVIWYSGFGPNGLDLNVYVWARREDFIAVQNNLQANILDEIRARNLRLAIQEHHVVLDRESAHGLPDTVRDLEALHLLEAARPSDERTEPQPGEPEEAEAVEGPGRSNPTTDSR